MKQDNSNKGHITDNIDNPEVENLVPPRRKHLNIIKPTVIVLSVTILAPIIISACIYFYNRFFTEKDRRNIQITTESLQTTLVPESVPDNEQAISSESDPLDNSIWVGNVYFEDSKDFKIRVDEYFDDTREFLVTLIDKSSQKEYKIPERLSLWGACSLTNSEGKYYAFLTVGLVQVAL